MSYGLAFRIFGGLASELGGAFLESLLRNVTEGGSIVAMSELAINMGWFTNINADVLDACIEVEPDSTTGTSPSGLVELMNRFIRAVARASVFLSPEIAEELYTEMLQEGFSNAIQTGVGGALTTILNVWRGGQPVYPDELDELSSNARHLDTDTYSLLSAMSGLNLPSTAYKMVRGFNMILDNETEALRSQLSSLVDRINDAVMWMHEQGYSIALRSWREAIESIAETYIKTINLVDHVCERALSRLQELRSELETVKLWWEYSKEHPDSPLIYENEVELIAIENQREAEAVMNVVEMILQYMDEALENLSIDLSDVKYNVEEVIYRYITVLNKMVETAKLDLSDVYSKMSNTYTNVVLYRNAVDSGTKLEKPVEFEYQPPVVTPTGKKPVVRKTVKYDLTLFMMLRRRI